MKSVLFITTSASEMAGKQTGVWFEELSTPYYILKDAGVKIDIASPKGGNVPFDPTALEPENITNSVMKFRDDLEAVKKLENSLKLAEIDFNKYDAIFFPGGHGAALDLPFDEMLAAKLGVFFDSGKIVAAVCHGPAALVPAKRNDGKPMVYGRKVTSFSNAEEDFIGYTSKVPFLIETKFGELGGIYSCTENFNEYVVVDGNLITGQNPASSAKIAYELLKKLN